MTAGNLWMSFLSDQNSIKMNKSKKYQYNNFIGINLGKYEEIHP